MTNDAETKNLEERKFLYEFTRKEFEREDARWEAAERKATIFIPILVLLLGAAGVFGNWLLQEKMIPPRFALDWIAIFCIVLAYGHIFVSWIFIFNALRIRKFATSGLRGDDLVNYFLKRNLKKIYTGYAYRFARDAKKNKDRVDEKLEWLILGYCGILVAAILLIALLIMLGLHNWLYS